MRNLPPSASSWDITTLSRAQQLRTRSLIQSQMASRALTGGPFRPTPPAMLAPAGLGGPGGPAVPDPVFAGTSLARAPLVPVEPALTGVGPAELPLASAGAGAPSVEETRGSARRRRRPAAPSGPPVEGHPGPDHGRPAPRRGPDECSGGSHGRGRLRGPPVTGPSLHVGPGIVIPAAAGSLDAGPGEALFAHELTHAAQRARLGPNLPTESAPEGQRLEAQALATEMTFRTGAATGPPPSWPGPSSRRSESGAADDRGPTAGRGGGPCHWRPPRTDRTPSPWPSPSSTRCPRSPLPAPPGGATAVFTPSWSSVPSSAPPAPAGGIQRAEG